MQEKSRKVTLVCDTRKKLVNSMEKISLFIGTRSIEIRGDSGV